MFLPQSSVFFSVSRRQFRRQDKGGIVEKEDPFMKLLEANRARLSGKDMMMLGSGTTGGMWEIYPGELNKQIVDLLCCGISGMPKCTSLNGCLVGPHDFFLILQVCSVKFATLSCQKSSNR